MRKALGDAFWLALGAGLLTTGAFLWTRVDVSCVRPGPARLAACTVTRHSWLGLQPSAAWDVPGVTRAGSRPVERSHGESRSKPVYVLVLETPAGRHDVETSHAAAVDAAADALNELLDRDTPGRARGQILVWVPGLFAMLPGLGFVVYGARRLGRRLSRPGLPA